VIIISSDGADPSSAVGEPLAAPFRLQPAASHAPAPKTGTVPATEVGMSAERSKRRPYDRHREVLRRAPFDDAQGGCILSFERRSVSVPDFQPGMLRAGMNPETA
jgi:hypothetical protein